MSEVADRYRRLAGAFSEKVAAVPADGWESPSPCDAWTARDIVAHVVATQGMFLGFVGRELGDIPSVDLDPLGAWTAASSAVLGDLEDPDRAKAEFQGFQGPSTFEAGVDRFLCTDLVVHGWDLARATGLDDRIAPEDLDHVRRAAESFPEEGMRGPQAFGPALEPPPDADVQEQLLAFLGRRA